MNAASGGYTSAQVEQGKGLFAKNCASCHGDKGQGLAADWRKPGQDGNYPPPPLNGSAHTWHHSSEVLQRTLAEGGVKLGGSMPPFKEILNQEERSSVIAFVQSLWSDEIFQKWQQRFLKTSQQTKAPSQQGPKSNPRLKYIQARIGNRPLSPLKETPVSGIASTMVGEQVLYLDQSGRYLFTGELIDLEKGVNLTQPLKSGLSRAKVDQFALSDQIIYPAEGDRKARLEVLTDTTCPYCRKLHSELSELQQAGIEVHYIPFPRGGLNSEGGKEMQRVWCADNRQQALDIAKGSEIGELSVDGSCEEAGAVSRGHKLGLALGITGTPTLIYPDGTLQSGYLPASEIIAKLIR